MKSINIIFICLIYLISCGFITNGEKVSSLVKQGNKEYKTGNYQKAIELYNKALMLDSKNKKINFNIGNSYYHMKEYDKSASFYEKSDKNAKTLFNLGNSYFNEKEGKPIDKQIELCNKSIESYKNAMKFDSKNIQIKKNYEVAVKKSEELKKKQENQNEQQNKEQNKSGEKQKSDNKMTEEERKKEEAKAVLNVLQQGEKEDLKNNRMRYVIPNYNGKDW